MLLVNLGSHLSLAILSWECSVSRSYPY